MQNQQMDSTSCTFKMPMAPLPQPSQAETLLFNDILEEKSVALRNNMMEFLQVLPYRKFDTEFSNFLKHLKCMIHEGQRVGANVSRLTNSFQIASVNPRPSTSFHYRQSSSAMSMMNSHRNSTFRAPESSFQPVDSLNPFKPPTGNIYHLQPRVVLPRAFEQSSQTSNRSHSLLATVIEVSHTGDLNRKSNSNREHSQLPELLERPKSPVPPNGYSDVTMNEEELVSNSQQNDNVNDDCNSIESLLDNAGFKIVLGLPEDNKTVNNTVNQNNNQLNIIKNGEKFLFKWSVNTKVVKSSKPKPSKVVVLITGTLVGEDRATVIEKHHDAGILESRKKRDFVRTTHGFYRLVGNIIGGSPNELYEICRELKGIPRSWKKNVNELCGIVEKGSKNMALNFSLDSPAGPIKLVKPKTVANMNMSFTRNGKAYSQGKMSTQISNGKRKSFDHNELENKSKHRKFHAQAPPLTASTPKRPVKPCIYESPSLMLKKKMQNKTAARLTDQTSKIINDSISVAKKRSLIKEQQSNEFLKPKSPRTLKINHKQNDQISTSSCTESLNGTTKQSKQKAVNVSNVLNSINCKSANSSRKTADNYSTATVNSSNKSLGKLSVTTSKNSSNNSSKFKQISSSKDKSSSILKQAKQKENIANDISLSESKPVNKKNNNKSMKEVKKQTSLKVPVALKEKSNTLVIRKKKTPQCSSSKLGLFGDMDDDNISDNDFNMESSGKLSLISRGEKSRSETPPLFDKQWASTAKSLTCSNPPTPLSKSIEAKALKRIKAPKITLEEELKNEKKNNKKKVSNYEAVNKKINKLLGFGNDSDE